MYTRRLLEPRLSLGKRKPKTCSNPLRVVLKTPCIRAMGSLSPDGYGRRKRSGERLAHRAAWVEAHGPIPDGLFVCHHCDNRACVNVEHLFLGTHQDNMRDRDAKGRQARGLRHGMAKISDRQASLIRSGVAAGTPQIEFVKALGISKTLVSLIVSNRRRQSAGKSSQVVANHSGAAVGLPPPGLAITSMPEALRARAAGAIRIRKTESPYAARAERRGDLKRVVALLLGVRDAVRRGRSLFDAVATGDVDGWAAREALTNACGAPLSRWDCEQHRTQADRLALVERALGLYGYVAPRRGGWSVGGR